MKRDKEYWKKFIRDSWIALRPLSLSLAIGSTTLGITAAWREGLLFNSTVLMDAVKIVLVTTAGILAQSGANLINDYFEGSFRYYRPSGRKIRFLGADRTYFDIYVFMWGMACLGLACLIGLYLIYITNIQMLFIGLIGIIGSYAYTGEPFVYKRHGLGVVLSFILMGPLMVYGTYFPFALRFSWYPVVLALPASFLIPALMISNEMRDFSRDTRLSLGTLSVRIGSKASRLIYEFLVFGAFILSLFYVAVGIFPVVSLLVFLTFPTALKAHRSVSRFEGLGIPNTNRLHWQFTLILIITLVVG
ncbi:MAG: prenyltransferase [Acetivibrionales bacterium]|jgi:1,4-dihydroxy-2-naphthoate octaprenyltransferase